MKKLFVSTFLLALITIQPSGVGAQASCTAGLESVTLTPAAVTSALSTAPDNYVLCLAAGTNSNWDTQVDPTVGGTIGGEIRGAGGFKNTCTGAVSIVGGCGSAGQTVIRTNVSGQTVFGTNSPTTTYPVTISNIRFTDDGSSAEPYAILSWNGQTGLPWIIHHNDFIITDDCNIKVIFPGAKGGVIYRNYFFTNASVSCSGFTNVNVLDHAFAGDLTTHWESADTFGSADSSNTTPNQIYFETNYVAGMLPDLSSSSRAVIRFNELHNSSIGGHGFDSSATGQRALEMYHNKLYCDNAGMGYRIDMSNFTAFQSGTAIFFNNTFPAVNETYCGLSGGGQPGPIIIGYRKFIGCDFSGIAGWPGSYPDSYPASHQPGWSWISGSNQTVGASTTQGDPGGAGFQQALAPMYFFDNTNNTGLNLLTIGAGAPECQAMAYSNFNKTSGTTIVIPSGSAQRPLYANVGQDIACFLADLVGGTAPTIADSGSNSWSTTLQGGTNGSMRLSGWRTRVTTGGQLTVTFTHDSSSAARAAVCVVVRGLAASPIDKNPSVVTDNTSTYTAPATDTGGAPSQTNELVLGYFALNGPSTDTVAAGTGDGFTASCTACAGTYNKGFNGTTGSTDTTNVTIAVVFRMVTSTTGVNPTLTNTTSNRNGLAGTLTLASLSNDNNKLSILASDFIAANREYYDQASGIQVSSSSPFNGTVGTGWGLVTNRPSTCTIGVAYKATDEGEWNSLNAGNDGKFYLCTATNTWTARYGKSSTNTDGLPKAYPHPLATVNPSASTTSPNRIRLRR